MAVRQLRRVVEPCSIHFPDRREIGRGSCLALPPSSRPCDFAAQVQPGSFLLAGGPGRRASPEQVYMKVEDGLSGSGADVENRAISVLDLALARNICCRQMAVADDLG